jgi:Ni,Fe-hydrogenase III small subunit
MTVEDEIEIMGQRMNRKINGLFGRSLSIREVDAGSCNACEVEVTALSNPIYDMERFGIHIVASPRHADMLLVTGPVTRNMELALLKTYNATPEPKLVAAMGSCACNGGVFGETYASGGGVDRFMPVDVYIPGCPPRPQAVIFGLMVAVDKLEQKIKKSEVKG